MLIKRHLWIEMVPGTNLRTSRWVEPQDTDQFRVPEIPTEWNSWLNGRRKLPPTQEELDRNYTMMMRTIHRAKKLEEKEKLESTTADPPSPDYTSTITPESDRVEFPKYKEYELAPGVVKKEETKR